MNRYCPGLPPRSRMRAAWRAASCCRGTCTPVWPGLSLGHYSNCLPPRAQRFSLLLPLPAANPSAVAGSASTPWRRGSPPARRLSGETARPHTKLIGDVFKSTWRPILSRRWGGGSPRLAASRMAGSGPARPAAAALPCPRRYPHQSMQAVYEPAACLHWSGSERATSSLPADIAPYLHKNNKK